MTYLHKEFNEPLTDNSLVISIKPKAKQPKPRESNCHNISHSTKNVSSNNAYLTNIDFNTKFQDPTLDRVRDALTPNIQTSAILVLLVVGN
jgi:hypothetical protein